MRDFDYHKRDDSWEPAYKILDEYLTLLKGSQVLKSRHKQGELKRAIKKALFLIRITKLQEQFEMVEIDTSKIEAKVAQSQIEFFQSDDEEIKGNSLFYFDIE